MSLPRILPVTTTTLDRVLRVPYFQGRGARNARPRGLGKPPPAPVLVQKCAHKGGLQECAAQNIVVCSIRAAWEVGRRRGCYGSREIQMELAERDGDINGLDAFAGAECEEEARGGVYDVRVAAVTSVPGIEPQAPVMANRQMLSEGVTGGLGQGQIG